MQPGTRLGPYEIVALIGAGGMGEVYRARDTRLEREVALKVLPAATMADETARARLLREARMASKLNHPNVCTIHEVGEAEGQAYIAMELVEGQPLSARLAGGRMPVDQVVRLGQQLSDALSHAHEHGVVHRDFKSPNVILTPEGRAKVLDFGLAKPLMRRELGAATTLTQASLTEAGAMLGTLAYMAPEQLRGQPADARSDIWALGVVLYEMAGGVQPFGGKTGFELSSAILNQAPKALPPDVPPPLASVIERCLAKAPAQRYQRAGEVRSALEAVASGSAPSPWPAMRASVRAHRWQVLAACLAAVVTILAGLDVGGLRSRLAGRGAGSGRAVRMAVLPFANLTGDPEQEYLSDGVTQEMIAQLGRLHPGRLSVIARTSVMRYKKGDTPIDQIGRELKVDYVLEGSARREANRVRITAELVHVRDQAQLWADTYERELSGVLALQSEVAQRVAKALALELLPAEQARLANVRAVDPEAHDAYLKGSYHWKKLTRAEIDTAERYFDLAVAKDPSYAPAHQGLAWVWAARQQMGLVPAREAGPKAKAAALEAIRLDESSAEAHEALALVRSWTDWDWTGAAPEWKRTLELNPNGANAHAYYSHFLANVGRPDEALTHIGRALELDPFNALFHAMRAVVLSYHGRSDEVIAEARTALAMQPDLPPALSALQRAWFAAGMRDELLADLRQRVARDPEYAAAFERGLAEGGFDGALRRLVDVMVARYQVSGPRPGLHAMGIATRCIYTRDYGRAMDWLEKAYEEHEPNLPYLGERLYEPLRSNPRFQALLRRMNLPVPSAGDNRQPTGASS